jgi:hypothetical protein
MRTTSVDTQKTTMDLLVTTDCLENQIHAKQKWFRPWKTGQIQKISDCEHQR